jgi:Protein of unknown function (DUF3300)
MRSEQPAAPNRTGAGFVLAATVQYNSYGIPAHRGWGSDRRGRPGPELLSRHFSLSARRGLTASSRMSRKRGFMRIRPAVVFLLALVVAAATAGPLRAAALPAQDAEPQDQGQYQNQDQNPYPDQAADQYEYQNFSPDQLDNLLGPIALYPDPLLAQVLVAATFPDQIDEAARYLRAGADPNGIDYQPWDVSVKSVAHYPTVLYMMDNRLDWTTSIGQAYVNQSTDVQESIQRLRGMAYNAGTLVSGPQIEVVQEGPYWNIWPVNPQFIYVPVYNPAFVYYGRPGWHGPFITFGVGFPIGCWLNLGFQWGGPGIYYFGWGDHLPRWAIRSRPFIRVTNVYVSNRYRTIVVNRDVVRRRVNYENLNRYNGVHREVNYSNLHPRNFAGGAARPGERPGAAPNQLVQHNIDTRDSRIQDFRGREGQGARMTMEGQGRPAPQEQARPEQARPEQARPQQGQPGQARPEQQRPEQQRPAPQRPRPEPAPQARPAPTPRPSAPSAFNTDRGTFGERQASQRGQASRQEMSRPAPAARPAPPGRSAPPPQPSRGRGKP